MHATPQGHNVGIVLVHGGAHTSRCWDPVTPHLTFPSVAVDLDGRGARAGGLGAITIAQWVQTVISEIHDAGFERAVLVGHSMAGVTIPAVAIACPDRVAHLVFLSCAVPREGRSMVGSVPWAMRLIARPLLARRSDSFRVSHRVARALLCNGMDPEQTRLTLEGIVPEAIGPFTERVSRAALLPSIPRTWIRPLHDRVITRRNARHSIRDLDAAVVTLDAGHNAFTTRPSELASILNEIAGGACP